MQALTHIVDKAQTNPKYWEIAIRASQLLLSWGYSKPPQLQDTTVSANINTTQRIATTFVISDLAPPYQCRISLYLRQALLRRSYFRSYCAAV
jgi:hypothetical protein